MRRRRSAGERPGRRARAHAAATRRTRRGAWLLLPRALVHELAIADAIARIAREHAAGRPVRLVRVRIGHLRQVVPSALRFGFELIAQGTPLDGAALAIEAVPAAARCRACGAETPQPRFPLACRACGSLAVTVVCGEELYVESLEVEDATDRAETGRERRRAAAEPARSLP